ncbi:MAG: serine hydrolase domain-containing protein [Bacteroidota bacterium]
MKKIGLIVLSTLFIISCKQKTEATEANLLNSLTDSLTQKLVEIHKQGEINGFGVAIVNQEGTLYEAGIGYADMEAKKDYSSQTVQNIGSVSKTVIGIALMKAQEMGKLQLDDPINQYLPFEVKSPSFPNDTITIWHLATHTSSIIDSDYYNGKAYVLKDATPEIDSTVANLNEQFNSPNSKMPMIDFLEKMLAENGEWYVAEGFSKNKPGTIYEYSNVGATLAAAVLEIAVETPYDTFTQEHILKPLQMESSGWSFETIQMEQHSKLYAAPDTELPFYSLITYPDGGLITNSSELGKYLTELIRAKSGNSSLLRKESYAELFKEQLTAESFPERDEENDFDDEYNAGIFMGHTPKGYIGHTGGDPGIAAFMFFDPKTNLGRVLFINTSLRNSEGVDEFFAIWDALGEYAEKLNAIQVE